MNSKMKKMLFSVAVLSIVAVAALNLNLNAQKHSDSLLTLANSEALASGESGSYLFCYKTLQYEEGAKTQKCIECVIYLNRSPAEQSAYGKCPS